MTHYRLVADHGHPTVDFEAQDDASAEVTAREMSGDTSTSKTTAFRLERDEAGTWPIVAAWMPRRVWAHPGGLETLVAPEPHEQ